MMNLFLSEGFHVALNYSTSIKMINRVNSAVYSIRLTPHDRCIMKMTCYLHIY